MEYGDPLLMQLLPQDDITMVRAEQMPQGKTRIAGSGMFLSSAVLLAPIEEKSCT